MHPEYAEHHDRIRRFAETLYRIAGEPETPLLLRVEAAVLDVLEAENLGDAVAAELERLVAESRGGK